MQKATILILLSRVRHVEELLIVFVLIKTISNLFTRIIDGHQFIQ